MTCDSKAAVVRGIKSPDEMTVRARKKSVANWYPESAGSQATTN